MHHRDFWLLQRQDPLVPQETITSLQEVLIRVPGVEILLVSPHLVVFQRVVEADPQVVAAALRVPQVVAREAVPRVETPRAVRARARAVRVVVVPRVPPLVEAVVALQVVRVAEVDLQVIRVEVGVTQLPDQLRQKSSLN